MFPTIQLVERPGIIDLGWGHPSPALLPVAAIQQAATQTLAAAGTDALTYGADQGAGPLLEWLHGRIAQGEGRALGADEIAITGGASDALDQICTLWTRPGDTVLVEAPTYHLALRILRDHAMRIVPVPVDECGVRLDALAGILADLRRTGRHPRLVYTIPTFHNPTGHSLSQERRLKLVALAAAEEILIIEDDVYRELTYDGPAPPSLWSIAPAGTVVRLGSFSKSLAPGLRLGWITGGAEHIQTLVRSGLRDSGGGVNHFASMIVATLCRSGQFEAHVTRLRAAYRTRRDTLLAAVAASLPSGCTWTRPEGGYFLWITLPAGMDAEKLLPFAEAAGVSYVPGQRFFVNGGGADTLRLAFSLYGAEALDEAAHRLGKALHDHGPS